MKKYTCIFALLLSPVLVYGQPDPLFIWPDSATCDSGSSDPQNLSQDPDYIFVDLNNCDCSDDATLSDARDPTTPFCTLRGLHLKTLSPGDKVVIREGPGDIDISKGGTLDTITIYGSGADGNRKSISSYPGERATIRAADVCISDCSTSEPVYSYYRMIYLRDIHELTLSDITFIGHIDQPNSQKLYRVDLIQHLNGDDFEIKNIKVLHFESMSIDGVAEDIAYGKRFYVDALDEKHDRNQVAQGITLTKTPPGQPGAYTGTGGIKVTESTFDCLRVPGQLLPEEQEPVDEDAIRTPSYGHALDISRTPKGDSEGLIAYNTFGSCGHSPLRLLAKSSNLTIERNLFSNRVHSGINLYDNTGNVIRNNIFKDENEFPWVSSFAANGLNFGAISDTQVYNNLFIGGFYHYGGVSVFHGIGSAYDDVALKSENNLVFNNTFYDNGGVAISLVDKQGELAGVAGVPRMVGTKVFNNLVFNTKGIDIGDETGQENEKTFLNVLPFDNLYRDANGAIKSHEIEDVIINFGYPTGSSSDENTVFNNLLYDSCFDETVPCDDEFVVHWGQATFNQSLTEFQTNGANDTPTYDEFAFSNVSFNPDLVDPDNDDFNPLPTSSVIGLGVCNQSYYPAEALFDFNGYARSTTPGCTIGAFERTCAASIDVASYDSGTSIYTASGEIEVAENANDYVMPGAPPSSSAVEFSSGTSITLYGGFSSNGSPFIAHIQGCSPENPGPNARVGAANDDVMLLDFVDSKVTTGPENTAIESYPNPFNPTTTITFRLKKEQRIKLDVFDILGKRISTLVDGVGEIGAHQIQFDSSNYGLGSGSYFVVLTTEEGLITKQLFLLK